MKVVHSKQIGFTPEQYQTLLALLQQSKSSDNVFNQISVFLPTQQHTRVINLSLPLVLGFLIMVLLIIFVNP